MSRIALALLSLGVGVATAGIEWEKDLPAARAAAKEDGRPVLAYFTFET